MRIPLYHFKKHGQYPDGFKYTNHTYAYIDKLGIWFSYKGDEVGWIFPWHRKANQGKRFSVVTLGFIPVQNLKEIDKFWEEYHEACQKVNL